MSLTIIFILIGVGILLLLAEVLVLPGVNVAGVIGFILIVTAVYMAFVQHGKAMGLLSLLIALSGSVLSLVMAMRSKTWDRLSLKNSIESKTADEQMHKINVGSEGKTLTTLNPIGKVQIGSEVFDARSEEGFLDQDITVTVKQVAAYELVVKPLNNKL